MMCPPLAKARDEQLPTVFRDWKLLAAALLLPDQPESMTGLIPVGLARCIAMVLAWKGIVTRVVLRPWKDEAWYAQRFLPAIAPVTLVALLLTIVARFSLEGDAIVRRPPMLLRIETPLLLSFVLMFLTTFWRARKPGTNDECTATLASTASGNEFELTIAVAIAVFGVDSGVAFAAMVEMLVEAPALIGLVNVSLRLGRRCFPAPLAKAGA